MNEFSKRSEAVEIMDDLNCSGEIVNQTLREIDTINRWLGGNAITLAGVELLIRQSKITEVRLADIGCGSGDMLKLINRALMQRNVTAFLTGIDANPNIITFAKNHCRSMPEINFHSENVLSETFQNRKFDIITATLFLHHFKTDQLIELLRSLKNQSSMGIVINDLHRHPLAYYAIKGLTTLFSKSSMVKYDAPLSVHRGFTRSEWTEIMDRAGIESYALTWKWAFRWQLIIYN